MKTTFNFDMVAGGVNVNIVRKSRSGFYEAHRIARFGAELCDAKPAKLRQKDMSRAVKMAMEYAKMLGVPLPTHLCRVCPR